MVVRVREVEEKHFWKVKNFKSWKFRKLSFGQKMSKTENPEKMLNSSCRKNHCEHNGLNHFFELNEFVTNSFFSSATEDDSAKLLPFPVGNAP